MEMTYSKKQAMVITGVTAKQIAHWASTGVITPSVKSGIGKGNRREYSFKDLVQLKVARRLRDGGLSLNKIRRTVEYLRKNFPETASPLAEFRFLTDGKDLFRMTKDPAVMLDALSGQLVWSFAFGQIVDKVRGDVERLMPSRTEKVRIRGKEYSIRIVPDPMKDRVVATCDDLVPGISCCDGTARAAVAKLAFAIEEAYLDEADAL